MKTHPHHINVLLNRDAIIVKFECSLVDSKVIDSDMIGKNWFDTFIETTDKEKVLTVFKELFDNKTEKWKTYNNDVKCSSNHHRYIDFENEIITKDGQKLLHSYGIEHMENI